MSTRGSLNFRSVGTYCNSTEFSWHVYNECLDDSYHLEVTLFSRDVMNVTVPGWLARWL